MGTPRFLLPSLALVSCAVLGSLQSSPGQSPPGGSSHADGDQAIAALRGPSTDGGLSENWYQYFCSPGWDDSVTTPCGMYGNGVRGRGCKNSAPNSTGAKLDVLSGDAAADDVVLIADGVKPGALSVFLQGPWKSATGLPFGDGVRCATGPIKRLYAKSAPGGVAVAPTVGEPSIKTRSAALGDPIPSPGTRYYQVWYRDGANHFNVTSALQIDWP